MINDAFIIILKLNQFLLHYVFYFYIIFMINTLGDIRLTPFYKIQDCVATMKECVSELNKGKKYQEHILYNHC